MVVLLTEEDLESRRDVLWTLKEAHRHRYVFVI